MWFSCGTSLNYLILCNVFGLFDFLSLCLAYMLLYSIGNTSLNVMWNIFFDNLIFSAFMFLWFPCLMFLFLYSMVIVFVDSMRNIFLYSMWMWNLFCGFMWNIFELINFLERVWIFLCIYEERPSGTHLMWNILVDNLMVWILCQSFPCGFHKKNISAFSLQSLCGFRVEYRS